MNKPVFRPLSLSMLSYKNYSFNHLFLKLFTFILLNFRIQPIDIVQKFNPSYSEMRVEFLVIITIPKTV